MKKLETELIARAIITHNERMLVCENKKGEHYFLPGGHVEFREAAKEALVREIKEEFGVQGNVGEMAGILENTYKLGDVMHHEINLIFSASIPTTDIVSLEDHIAFHWIKFGELSTINLLPSKLSKIVSKWLNDKETFFESSIT
ncbi:hypothetical protein A2737_01610 [Candidatus Nomurabacteria bacterium RIFCSPHIGHO2_01_FULL_41_71]|nr:MAG: hypothetical protein A2737_01610 [Candidatus Nomurabacteria bacterium RIFCSPHIGHO2_01_FULL_41_71]